MNVLAAALLLMLNLNSSKADDFFPILAWGATPGDLKALKEMEECGITIAGFVSKKDLDLVQEAGLKAIVRDSRASGYDFRNVNPDEARANAKSLAKEVGNHPALFGYYIKDEPNAEEFPGLAIVAEAFVEQTPDKCPYINLFPNYATIGAKNKSQLGTDSYTEHLEKFVNKVKSQILSYDNYMVQYSHDLKERASAASYYNNLMEVRRIALKYDIPFWNIVSSNQIRTNATIPSPANLLFQAYTSLAAGARGISWYKYSYHKGYDYAPMDESGNKTLTWHYLQMVNRQIKALGPTMNRLNSTGAFFTSPPPVESLPVLPGRLVKEVQSDAPMMVGEFISEDEVDYIMVVNLSLEKSAKFVLKIEENHKIQIVSAEDGRLLPMNNEKGVWLVAGQGILVRVYD